MEGLLSHRNPFYVEQGLVMALEMVRGRGRWLGAGHAAGLTGKRVLRGTPCVRTGRTGQPVDRWHSCSVPGPARQLLGHPLTIPGLAARPRGRQAWRDVVGLDYAARLMEDARLVLEARALAKRVFASVRSHNPFTRHQDAQVACVHDPCPQGAKPPVTWAPHRSG